MITIKQLKSTDFEKEYYSLLEEFYKNEEGFAYYFSDLQKGFHYTFTSEFQQAYFFCAYKDDKLAGTVSLIIDTRLDMNSCFFGFFEVINDKEVFDSLWYELTKHANSLFKQKILGPINGSIWHQYRVIGKNLHKKRFPSEPITKNYYVDFLKSKNHSHQEEYHSAFRTNFDVIMNYTKTSYKTALSSDIKIEKITGFNVNDYNTKASDKKSDTSNSTFDLDLFKVLYGFSKHIFSKNWGFVPLNFNEFLQLYNSDKINEFIGSVYVAKFNSKIIGFCMNIETSDALIMKTIAVVPEFQQKGIANALVYTVHNDAKQNQKNYVIYALINKKNKIQYFPQDEVTIMREYVAYEFSANIQ